MLRELALHHWLGIIHGTGYGLKRAKSSLIFQNIDDFG
jgi:hypothetical protein